MKGIVHYVAVYVIAFASAVAANVFSVVNTSAFRDAIFAAIIAAAKVAHDGVEAKRNA